MEFFVEILETRIKTLVFDTESRSDAVAAGKVWYLENCQPGTGLSVIEGARIRDTEVKLQWPDGRPVEREF